MVNFSLAAKALIVNEGKILLIKRRLNDPHKPGVWDVPGGRIALEEDPILGIQREVLEEVGLQIEVICPLSTKHFTRDDGQLVTGINFYCKIKGTSKITLSEEHTKYSWETIPNAKKKIFVDLLHIIENYEKLVSGEMFK